MVSSAAPAPRVEHAGHVGLVLCHGLDGPLHSLEGSFDVHLGERRTQPAPAAASRTGLRRCSGRPHAGGDRPPGGAL
eukprot:8998211-Pyramimonas_sp.AAC.1